MAVLAMMLSMVNPVPLLIGITVVVAIEVGDAILGESEGLKEVIHFSDVAS